MTNKLTRRPLTFPNLDAVLQDVEHLNQVGYERVGNWDLGQIGFHIGEWLRYGMDGFPMKPLPWLIRKTFGVWYKKRLFRTGKFQERMMTAKESLGEPGRDGTETIEKLRTIIQRAKTYQGNIVPSPLFGPLTQEEWLHLNCIHCAHHLSFLLPKNG